MGSISGVLEAKTFVLVDAVVGGVLGVGCVLRDYYARGLKRGCGVRVGTVQIGGGEVTSRVRSRRR